MVNTELLLSRGTVWLYFSSHVPGNQFDLPFWILRSETINSSCLVLNSARSKQLVHAAVREAINRGLTSARQSGGSVINLFSSLICEPPRSPEHWDLQLYGVLGLPSHTSLWLPDPQGFTPHLAQAPVVLCLGCPQKQLCSCKRWWLQTWELRNLCSPRKQTCICHSHSRCINSDRATCVFRKSNAPVEVVQGHQALQWCFTAFCSLQHVLRREGRGFIRPKGAVGGQPSRHFHSLDSYAQPTKEGKSRSWGCYLFWSKSGICDKVNGKSPRNWGQHLSCGVYGAPLWGALINTFCSTVPRIYKSEATVAISLTHFIGQKWVLIKALLRLLKNDQILSHWASSSRAWRLPLCASCETTWAKICPTLRGAESNP